MPMFAFDRRVEWFFSCLSLLRDSFEMRHKYYDRDIFDGIYGSVQEFYVSGLTHDPSTNELEVCACVPGTGSAVL